MKQDSSNQRALQAASAHIQNTSKEGQPIGSSENLYSKSTPYQTQAITSDQANETFQPQSSTNQPFQFPVNTSFLEFDFKTSLETTPPKSSKSALTLQLQNLLQL